MDLNRDAMLVGLHIAAWSGRLYDRQASDHVAVAHEANTSAGRYNKRLLPKAAFAALTATMSEARTNHYANSLPWDDKGARLLTVANYEHYTELMDGFSKLADAGQSVSAIAARFGASERIVEQRLRLGNAAPELLDAYRANEIDLEVLKAFAVTADRERQIAVWEQVSGQGYRPSAWQVKRLLTEERIPGVSAIARFVGVDAYEAAGGQVMRDLFADEHERGVWFEDPLLLEKLATQKLQVAADELATRWKWATAMIEVSWDDTARYGRVDAPSAWLRGRLGWTPLQEPWPRCGSGSAPSRGPKG